jgi:hypothetical protein
MSARRSRMLVCCDACHTKPYLVLSSEPPNLPFSIHKTFRTRCALVLIDAVVLLTTDEQNALPRDATSHLCVVRLACVQAASKQPSCGSHCGISASSLLASLGTVHKQLSSSRCMCWKTLHKLIKSYMDLNPGCTMRC